MQPLRALSLLLAGVFLTVPCTLPELLSQQRAGFIRCLVNKLFLHTRKCCVNLSPSVRQEWGQFKLLEIMDIRHSFKSALSSIAPGQHQHSPGVPGRSLGCRQHRVALIHPGQTATESGHSRCSSHRSTTAALPRHRACNAACLGVMVSLNTYSNPDSSFSIKHKVYFIQGKAN